MAVMARAPRKKQTSQAEPKVEASATKAFMVAPATPQAYRPLPVVDNDTAKYYANYLEITATPFDFVLTMATVTNKHTPEQDEEIRRNGTLTVKSHLQVSIPLGFLPLLMQMLNLTAQTSSAIGIQGQESER